MTVKLLFIVSITCLSMSACNEKQNANVETTEPSKGAIPQHQLNALDKARGVEQTLIDAEQQRLQQIDEPH